MDAKPETTFERKELRVDYFPHRVRVTGGDSKLTSITPRDYAVVTDYAQVTVVVPKIVSEDASV